MGIYQWRQQIPRLVALFLISPLSTSHAVCNNPDDWLQAPSSGIKIFIDFDQEQPTGFAGIEGSVPFPAPLPKDMLEKAASESTPVSDLKSTSYYEPDKKGNWRICRQDRWVSKSAASGTRERVEGVKISDKYALGNNVLRQLAKTQQVFQSTIYWYDGNGRLSHVSDGVFEVDQPKLSDTYCYRYDTQNRLIRLVSPGTTKVCPYDEPDPRDSWSLFNPDARPSAQDQGAQRNHGGHADGSWVEEFVPFFSRTGAGFVQGGAKADSKNGVTEIYGSNAGELDDNASNKVVDSFGKWDGSTYVFLQSPIPLTVIDHPEQIYKYRRRRQTYVDGHSVRLYELFEPDAHIARQRYYLLGGFVVRQEQLNAQGKVTRVITIDGWHQPRPGPHPDVDDKLLTDKDLHFHGHQVYHRVYDIDANGKPKLVAISWGHELWIRGMKTKEYDWDRLVYGTPDGKERWKTQEDFEKAFDVSETAAKVFPDMQHDWSAAAH